MRTAILPFPNKSSRRGTRFRKGTRTTLPLYFTFTDVSNWSTYLYHSVL